MSYSDYNFGENEDRTWIDSLDEADVSLLRPRFLAEVTSLFDSTNKPLLKRKPFKVNRKTGTCINRNHLSMNQY